MRILILEDAIERHEWFLKKFWRETLEKTVDIVTTAAECIEALGRERYGIVFLDHDLAFHHYGTNDRDDATTGHAVAQWMAANRHKQPGCRFVVHSMNPSGGPRMVSTLRSAGIPVEHVPFIRLKETLRVA